MQTAVSISGSPRSRSAQRWRTWMLGWLCVPLLTVKIFAGEPVSKEYQVKAAFLYNFAKFVEWPAASFENESSPLVIGVFGENPFGGELENVVRGRKINGHPILVKPVPAAASAHNVHVLFISAAEDERLGEFRTAVRNAGILTVGESDEFVRRGGMIQFVPDGDKIRFEIRADQAAAVGLKISSQLLKLGRPRLANP